MIDVSYNSVRSGLVHHLCQILKNDLLDYLPKFVLSFSIDCIDRAELSSRDRNNEASTVRVGFATFDKQIHFYNIKVRSANLLGTSVTVSLTHRLVYFFRGQVDITRRSVCISLMLSNLSLFLQLTFCLVTAHYLSSLL